jgi:hypothetical protein
MYLTSARVRLLIAWLLAGAPAVLIDAYMMVQRGSWLGSNGITDLYIAGILFIALFGKEFVRSALESNKALVVVTAVFALQALTVYSMVSGTSPLMLPLYLHPLTLGSVLTAVYGVRIVYQLLKNSRQSLALRISSAYLLLYLMVIVASASLLLFTDPASMMPFRIVSNFFLAPFTMSFQLLLRLWKLEWYIPLASLILTYLSVYLVLVPIVGITKRKGTDATVTQDVVNR